jgi:hypothetical protein
MSKLFRHRRHFLLATVGASAALLAGCGQGEYDTRMNGAKPKRGGAAGDGGGRLEGNFRSVSDSTGPTGIKFKVPSVFVPPKGKQLGATEPNAKLAQADIPGFCYTLQTTLPDNNSQPVSAYCYVFAAPKATTPIESVKDLIKQGFASAAPNLSWTTGNVGGLPLHSATAAGTFEFDVNGAIQQLPGTISFSIVEGAEKFVMVAFRYENGSAAKNQLPAAIGDSVQSFASDAPAAAPPGPAPPGPMPPGPPGPAGS